ncbi:MAG TPA: Ig domain-containing protein [Gaiellaceae bacterium]|nr:Ig domain-containing protein [Gaiellaceae bacterium]
MKRRVTLFLTAVAAGLVFVSAAWALRFTDESYFPPVGSVGVPYSFAFGGAGGCGPALPYQYSLIGGSLPPGLSLSTSGVVSGTPTQAGSRSFWVNLSDQNPPSADWCRPSEAQREFTITINSSGGGTPAPAPGPAPSVSITTASLPGASVGSAYSSTLTASGSGAQSWSLVSGSLPAGLSLASNGALSGTPQAAGTATFTVKVSAGGATAQKQFTLEVSAAVAITSPATQIAEVAVPLTVALNASGGSAPYRWELKKGSLPTHVGFIGDQGNGSTALIKGVPADAGSFELTFTVTDVRGRSTTHTITLNVAERLRLSAGRLTRVGHVGRRFRAGGLAQGGVGTRTWHIVGNLPAGLRLDSATGVITGTPTRRGRYTFYLVAKDELGATRSLKLSMLIRR